MASAAALDGLDKTYGSEDMLAATWPGPASGTSASPALLVNSSSDPQEPSYVKRRLKHSTCRKLFSKQGFDQRSTETIVNSLAILNGLLLTVEFGLIASLDTNYWDDLAETLKQCGQGVPDYWPISVTLYFATLLSLVALFLCVIFLVLQPRPEGKHPTEEEKEVWRDWYKLARFTLISAVVFTEIVSGLLMALMILLFPRMVNSSAGICLVSQDGTGQRKKFEAMGWSAIAIILAFPVLSTVLLM